MAQQQVPASTALTAPLIFTDSSGATVKGPIGVVSSDVGLTPPASLSADGQAVNFTSPPSGAVTLTWSDPAGNFTGNICTFTDQLVAVTGSMTFGTAVPGTTA